uniref:Uncharacterized protein n=1 Tax=Meloidogyne enterolobii TaxID=390850 RepID=A0A6V7VA79_MELEN|nr:unnamed protein product [Meloidogyne enterolobii]
MNYFKSAVSLFIKILIFSILIFFEDNNVFSMDSFEKHKNCGIDPVSIDGIYLKLIFNNDENYVKSGQWANEYLKLDCYLILKRIRLIHEEINISIKEKQNIVENRNKKKKKNKVKSEKSKMSKSTQNKISNQEGEQINDLNKFIEDTIKLFSHKTNIQLRDHSDLSSRYIRMINWQNSVNADEDEEEDIEFINEQTNLLHYKVY